MERAKVLLADDHTIIADLLARYLRDEFNLVGLVDDGMKMLEAARRTKPDVIVADISMPVLSGMEALPRIKREMPQCKVIFLTMHRDASLAAEALRAGALGYLLKNSAGDELLAAIREVLDGKVHLSPSIAKGVLVELAGDVGGGRNKLTARQKEVLKLLATGLSMKEIGAQLQLSSRTVESHKYEMMSNLGVTSTAQLVQYAVRSGLTEP